MRIDPASRRSEKKNVLHGSTVESVLGKTKLAALTKPFLLHLKNGKVRAFPLLALVVDFSALLAHFMIFSQWFSSAVYIAKVSILNPFIKKIDIICTTFLILILIYCWNKTPFSINNEFIFTPVKKQQFLNTIWIFSQFMMFYMWEMLMLESEVYFQHSTVFRELMSLR